MDVQTILLVYILIPLLIIHLILTSDWFKDVPDLYLSEQSEIDATRLVNQSPIYRSNKLDLAGHVRAGLGIRYDSYKLRAGNLSDIWSIKSKRFEDVVVINDVAVKWAEINYIIHKMSLSTKVIRVPLTHKIDIKWVVVLLAGFINQVTIEFYDEEGGDIDDIDINYQGELHSYENEYSGDKDKGIALRLVRNQPAIGKTTIEFTQLNIVSAVASMIKHLPGTHEITDRDTMVIVPSEVISNEELFNIICKLLTCLITHCKLVITSTNNIFKYNPTILSIHEDHLPPAPPQTYLSYLNKICIPRGKLIPGTLRLIYINNKITSQYNRELTKLREAYNSRIIRELGYYNVFGPVILNDLYDYRTFNLNSGCISQSLELKIVNINQTEKTGLLNVRGYVIGKTNMKDNVASSGDGFMPVNVRCKWGNDGCLYIT
ncbi:hypothetical protein JA1_002315 [Spathaspora sp. JA1]|nr:hypothetical protein JA1_002315 [Spathaspora sp. JA1]